jgi:hypothetical protein
VWDLTAGTPLLTAKEQDQSGRRWNQTDTVGLKTIPNTVLSVEYFRDVQPILARSCVGCHNSQGGQEPAGQLDLAADNELVQVENEGRFPGTYYRLALDERAKFGPKPFGYDSWGYPNASRYIRKFQARRSLLVWKLFGERLDGFSNDDHPSPTQSGAEIVLTKAGKPVDSERYRAAWDLDFTGERMPPPQAVKEGKAAALTDDDRRTILRWIDLGCPIDLSPQIQAEKASAQSNGKQVATLHVDRDQEGDALVAAGKSPSYGYLLDDQRPVLAVTEPRAGENEMLERLLIGLHDYDTGIVMSSFAVTANFAIDDLPAGENLAKRFKEVNRGVHEYRLKQPIRSLPEGKLTVVIQDRQGNQTRIERTLWIGKRSE